MEIKPEMKPFLFLIGKWHTDGEIITNEDNGGNKFNGTDSYEWILDGEFILHKVDVVMNSERVEAIEIIGEFDAISRKYKMRSLDNQGSFTEMELFIVNEKLFYISGDKMRARLIVINNNTLKAHWENSRDNKNWFPWMNLTLSK